MLTPWKKSYDEARQHIKKQRHHFTDKGPSSQLSCTDDVTVHALMMWLIGLIRNLVARSQAFSQPILDLGAEALISRARAAHRDCEDVAKAALRDLGCHVELRELWTGQKGDLAP